MRTLPVLSLLGAAGALLGALLGAVHPEEAPAPQAGTALRLDTEGLVAHSAWIVEGRVLSRRTVERLERGDAFDGLVEKIEKHMADRGLEKARVRRVGVSAWSAGYGAVFTLLESWRNS